MTSRRLVPKGSSGCRKRYSESPILVWLRYWDIDRGHCRLLVTYWNVGLYWHRDWVIIRYFESTEKGNRQALLKYVKMVVQRCSVFCINTLWTVLFLLNKKYKLVEKITCIISRNVLHNRLYDCRVVKNKMKIILNYGDINMFLYTGWLF